MKYRISESSDGRHVGKVIDVDMALFAQTKEVAFEGRTVDIDIFKMRSDGKFLASNSNYSVILEVIPE